MASRKTIKKSTKEKEKFTTSKKIVYLSCTIAFILAGLVAYGQFKGYDVSILGNVAIAAWVEVTGCGTFYFWKAKKENTMKLALSVVKETSTEKVDDVVKLLNAMGGIV